MTYYYNANVSSAGSAIMMGGLVLSMTSGMWDEGNTLDLLCRSSCQVRERNSVHVIAETQYVVSCVKDDSDESLHVELCLKPFKVIEVFFPNRGTAFHFYPSAMPIIALNVTRDQRKTQIGVRGNRN